MLFLKNRKKSVHKLKGELPVHIAIIMDGNGRWAEKRELPRNVGHRRGAEVLKEIVKAADDMGIKYVTAYAFSTENWNRPKNEVDGLMNLLFEFLKNADNELRGRNIRIKVIGDEEGLSSEIRHEIRNITRKTSGNDGLTLIIALNYGGRTEITNAVKQIAKKAADGIINPDNITEETVSQHLYTSDIPDPDLMIRPSGEKRISNFLLWQMSYTEFWFSNILWPDFTKEDLKAAIEDYQKRNRRFGGI
jgi:undecaprenyl diphosphate synthase